MTTENVSKRPSHYIYAVTRRNPDDKGFWTRIGAAWPHTGGFSVKMDLMPIGGADIVMREPRDDDGAK